MFIALISNLVVLYFCIGLAIFCFMLVMHIYDHARGTAEMGVSFLEWVTVIILWPFFIKPLFDWFKSKTT